jgi:hypothetical protein
VSNLIDRFLIEADIIPLDVIAATVKDSIFARRTGTCVQFTVLPDEYSHMGEMPITYQNYVSN